tara:strand:+ start:772 stop:942 length:171 start_codon:yes stop_codon:yes gene_type:complete
MAQIRGRKTKSKLKGYDPYDDEVMGSAIFNCCCPPGCWTRSRQCCLKPIGQRPWFG